MSQGSKNAEREEHLKDLALQVLDGDKQAYGMLLKELHHFIKNTARAQLHHFARAHAADDVTQEALLSIHLKFHTYDRAQAFLPWVRAVTKYRLIDYLRREKFKNVSIDDESFYELQDPVNPEDAIISRDINTLLGQLKPPAGDIIRALKIDGASTKEIAERFMLSESNVKVIVHRSLQKLSALARKPLVKGGTA